MNVVAPLFILAPIIFLVVRYRLLRAEGKVLLYYLLIDALVSLVSSVLAFKHVTNLPLYHFATIAETVILLYFFYLILRVTIAGKFVKWMLLLFPVLGIFNMLFLQHIYAFNSYMLSLQSMIVIALCFTYWLTRENEKNLKWTSVPLNWILAGLLMYFASSFVLLTFSNIIITASKHISILIWNIHATLSIIMYGMLCAGISKFRND